MGNTKGSPATKEEEEPAAAAMNPSLASPLNVQVGTKVRRNPCWDDEAWGHMDIHPPTDTTGTIVGWTDEWADPHGDIDGGWDALCRVRWDAAAADASLSQYRMGFCGEYWLEIVSGGLDPPRAPKPPKPEAEDTYEGLFAAAGEPTCGGAHRIRRLRHREDAEGRTVVFAPSPPTALELTQKDDLQLFWRVHAGDVEGARAVLARTPSVVEKEIAPYEFPAKGRLAAWPYQNFDGEYGDTALALATRYRHTAMVELLVSVADGRGQAKAADGGGDTRVSTKDKRVEACLIAQDSESAVVREFSDCTLGATEAALRGGGNGCTTAGGEADGKEGVEDAVSEAVGTVGLFVASSMVRGCGVAGLGTCIDPPAPPGGSVKAGVCGVGEGKEGGGGARAVGAAAVGAAAESGAAVGIRWLVFNGHSDANQVEYCRSMVERWQTTLIERGDEVLSCLECPTRMELDGALANHFRVCRETPGGGACGVFAIVHGDPDEGAWCGIPVEGGGDGSEAGSSLGWGDLEELGALNLGKGGQLFIVSDSCYSAKMGKKAFASVRRRHLEGVQGGVREGGEGEEGEPGEQGQGGHGRGNVAAPPPVLGFLAASLLPEKNFSGQFALEAMATRRKLSHASRLSLRLREAAGQGSGVAAGAVAAKGAKGAEGGAEGGAEEEVPRALEMVERIPVEGDDFAPWWFFYAPMETVVDPAVKAIYII
jgi:hypothetical protein